jgi:hypothetical protein
MKLTLASLALMGGLISLSLPAAAQAGAPLPVLASGGAATIAPMLKEITPGVVNIAVRGRVREQNPLLQDPFFAASSTCRRTSSRKSARRRRPVPASLSMRRAGMC